MPAVAELPALAVPTATVAIIGGGPAGLMAAEVLARQGIAVDVYDAMPSVGRKFLLAGKGGLNLTHAEDAAAFRTRYGSRAPEVARWLDGFDAAAVREWATGLGIETFVGSSGRVFPVDMKAAPLLRAWLHRLRGQGVRFHMRHRWLGWSDNGGLSFATPNGPAAFSPRATLLALGGASWARLGSDGAWWPLLEAQDIELAPLQASNCGFDVGWSEHLASRHAGAPLKSVAIVHGGVRRKGEFVLTGAGVEGSLVYAFSAALRDELRQRGDACFELDLLPDRSLDEVRRELARPRGPRSLSTHLKSRLKLDGAKAALLHELAPREALGDPGRLAALIKALAVRLRAPRPIDEAISTAGGVRFEALDEHQMLRRRPGVFCAGEMVDWEAPTGGYLLTACLASGRAAGQGIAAWLGAQE